MSSKILLVIIILLTAYINLCNRIVLKEKFFSIKNHFNLNGKVYVINLEKRKDRKNFFIKIFDNMNINKVLKRPNFYKAVNGFEEKIPSWWFKENPYKWVSKEGSWGCFMSHYNLLKKFVKSKDSILVVLEDDTKFKDKFNENFVKFIENTPKDWEVLYLGFTNNEKPIEVNKYCDRTTSVNTTVGYVVNKKGANEYLKILNRKLENKDNEPFDCTLSRNQKDLKIYQPKDVLIDQNKELESDVYAKK